VRVNTSTLAIVSSSNSSRSSAALRWEDTGSARCDTPTAATVVDFHVGPVFPDTPGAAGRHRYLVEFAQPPADMQAFAQRLDETLGRLNEDYAAHRAGDLTMLAPEVCMVQRGGFAQWMRSRGKLGGQHKLPRMDATGRLTEEISRILGEGRGARGEGRGVRREGRGV